MRQILSLPLSLAALALVTFSGLFAASSHAGTAATRSPTAATNVLDVDNNGSVDPLTDGILMIRYVFGLRGASLIAGAVGPGATRMAAEQIGDYLASLYTPASPTNLLDADDNGPVDALTDGILLMRYMFGLRGQALVQGAIGTGANRGTAALVEDYMPTLYSPHPANCSVSASPASSVANPLPPSTAVTLSASCALGTPPFTFTWNVGFTGSALAVTPSATTTYTVTPSNASGTGSVVTATVYIGNVQPPSNCSIQQSPNTANSPVTVGTPVALTATCNGGNPPTFCSWSGGVQSTSCAITIQAPSVTTIYSATASNGAGNALAASTTVNVVSQQGNQNFCKGGDQLIQIPWPAEGQIKYKTYDFVNNTVLSFQILVPHTFSPPLDISRPGFGRVAEVPGQEPAAREVTVSKNACDFQSGNYLAHTIGTGDISPMLTFTANNPNGWQQTGASFNVNSGDVIYYNVRNWYNGKPSCDRPTCNILFDFATPNR